MDHLNPEQLFGNHHKPFHRTGNISKLQLERNLTSSELDILTQVTKAMLHLAPYLSVDLCLFIVGSAADLSATHGDVDAVCCVEPIRDRGEFVKATHGVLVANPALNVVSQRRNSLTFGRLKLFVSDGKSSTLDLTFVGPGGWTMQEMRLFHAQNNLAYCEYI